MRTRPASRLNSERGATLVHVAIALVSLMGIAAYAVDRGIVWISRGQAQNAADAGALAGAVARAFDDTDDPPGRRLRRDAGDVPGAGRTTSGARRAA